MLYLDPSAWAKRYLHEPDREALEGRLHQSGALYTSAISYAEMHATLARKRRRNEISQPAFLQARNNFEVDWLLIQEVAVDRETLGFVPALVERFALRGMDAIHLAAARWLESRLRRKPEIVSADARLVAAARRLQFTVFNPAEK